MKVLNDGFIELVDHMGNDQRVLDAARVSTGASSKGPDRDRKLINYLMKNEHHTPFEKVVFEFHVRCPYFVARQWQRHRVGSYNEESARYKEFEFSPFWPKEWRSPGKTNHQGSVEGELSQEQIQKLDSILEMYYKIANNAYHELIKTGAAREHARIVLPMGQYTEFYWTVNFRSLMNFLVLRDDDHAQKEIRVYAQAIRNILSEIDNLEMTYTAFNNLYKSD